METLPLIILAIGVASLSIAYGLYQMKKVEKKKEVMKKEKEVKVVGVIEKKEMATEPKESEYFLKQSNVYKRTRFVDFDIFSGIKLGFGFGMGLFFAWVVIMSFATIFLVLHSRHSYRICKKR